MKSFFEVFPSLNVDGDLYDLLKYVDVERLSAPKDMSTLSIYLHSERLIEKKYIFELKELIKNRLFKDKIIHINIIESFNLSSQYTPKILFESYKESILLELRQYNITQYIIFKFSEISFYEERTLRFTVEDNIINRKVISDLVRVLEKIFIERCGISCIIEPVFVEAVKREVPDMYVEVISNADNTDKAKDLQPNEKTTSKQKVKSSEDKKEKPEKKENNVKPKQTLEKKSKSEFYRNRAKSDNPDVIFGRDFDDKFLQIADIIGQMGEVNLMGQIIKVDSRFIEKTQSTLYMFNITDFTDSITVKMFVREDMVKALKDNIKIGNFIKLRGALEVDRFDGELIIGRVFGIKKAKNNLKITRVDDAPVKRIELHCHTKMSDFDGVASAKDIVTQAYKWGMEAVAITDHGNVAGFTEGFHALDKIKKEGVPPKIIYGLEGYLVDDVKEVVISPNDLTLDDNFVVFDIETTGFSPIKDRIIEIGAVRVEGGKIVDKFQTFVNPEIPIPLKIEELTSINDSMVMSAPLISEILPKFLKFCENAAVVAHNAGFDTRFIKEKSKELELSFNPCIVDTVLMARLLLPKLGRFKLDNVAKALGVQLLSHHRAVDDAGATAEIWVKFIEMLKAKDIHFLKDINNIGKMNLSMIKKSNTTHITILAKNELGRINLYRLVSMSNVEYFNIRPRIPKSKLNEFREGLILGSGCANGELMSAIIDGESDENIRLKAMYYDYLEVQPVNNYAYMIDSDKYSVNSMEELIEINKKIIRLGEELGKLVVATGDVHFLNPEDVIYRKILHNYKKLDIADNQPNVYFHTTEEMLKEFDYLEKEKAYEIVVTNTRKIADMIENIKPVRPDKCPPSIENSDEILTKSCYEKAHKQYGENLPEIVSKRLEKELNSIIKNGFAVMYIIAKKLVEKSNSDGYLVGSRGSVGSSFAAYTSGITEVNPLPPHYYCECKYVDFDSEDIKACAGKVGCDLPDKICPNCGRKLKKDGFDIPFETFLGFKGDKEPDIDLNFSGEYQSVAHEYTEELFGKGYTYRAGTTATVAEKTAYGYVKKYLEEHEKVARKAEIERISMGCVGVKRTTGQHPGGIIVLPHGEEIYSFTPIQRPADDVNTKTLTTQFDYHSIDHNLLKLDILGHQDPTMIRMLQDLIGTEAMNSIPFDSKETMELFKDTSSIKVSPEDIMGCRLGARGIPEFGTDFAIQMLIDAKPQGFSDLIRISGLSHGTDVWVGNALTLIQEGKATIGTAICTRDDIMTYLISMGMEEGISFKIMESVRKGKGLTPEWEEEMLSHNVPDWYIWSCKKIKYMFPKAHAAAYVMMAWRIAYCKIFYPIEYYTSFFSIRAKAFSYELMCFGKAKVEMHIKQLYKIKGNKNTESNSNTENFNRDENVDSDRIYDEEESNKEDSSKEKGNLTAKDEDTLRDLLIVQEMYARGFEFAKMDIYKAKAQTFTITEDKKIMPSLASIEGLGEVVANQIEIAAKQGEFISKEDFMQRTGAGKAICELMDKFGLLGSIPQKNQISFFDK